MFLYIYFKIICFLIINHLLFYRSVRGITFSNEGENIVLERNYIDEVILNCPYDLDENDHDGLVVSWFYNDIYYPIYQWIPFQKPQVLGFLKNFADTSYESSDRDYYRFSSIRLFSPSTNLTGRYQCKVSSFTDEKTYNVNLVLYSKPSTFDMIVTRRNEKTIIIQCLALFGYPEPHLRLFKVSHNKRILLGNGILQSKWADGAYNVTIEADVDDIQLDGLTMFECHLTIPQTTISLKKNIKYIPRSLPNMRHRKYSYCDIYAKQRKFKGGWLKNGEKSAQTIFISESRDFVRRAVTSMGGKVVHEMLSSTDKNC